MSVLIQYYGGKQPLSNWIIYNLPKDYIKLHYIEPFGQSLAVFLNKKPSKLEFNK